MTREEILALDLKQGERILVEIDVNKVDRQVSDSKTLCVNGGHWIDNYNIHSIRRVEKAELSEAEKTTVESNYVSLDEFHKRNQFARRIYAFQIAREFAEKGEEMPDDLRNEIAGYIAKSPEIEGIKTEEKTEVEGVDFVLDIDGNQMRVGDKCERVRLIDDKLKGVLVIEEIKSSSSITVSGDALRDPRLFRKVN